MRPEPARGFLIALGLPLLVAGAAAMVTRIALRSSASATASSRAAESRWREIERRLVERLVQQPDDYLARLKLANCRIELGEERALRHCVADVLDPGAVAGHDDASRLERAFSETPECESARSLARSVLREAAAPAARARVWELLAVIAVRSGDLDEHQRCLAAASALRR
jgi:hypothetical protein